MHILLVVPRYSDNWGEFYQIPLGLGYIASAIRRAGHRVSSLNLNHYRGTVENLVTAKVSELNPDVCATGSLAPFLSTLASIFAAARAAKPGIINIAGGGLVSGEPEMSLRVLDIDIGVVSEGEQTIVELLDCLAQSGNLASVTGIVFRARTGAVMQTPPRAQLHDLSQIAWPDYELLECEKNIANQRALDSYFFHSHPDSKPRVVDMITSRSCPYSCTFCFHPVGKVYRERPLDDFFAELDMLVSRYQINMVALIDELFSLRQQRLLEFCERIKPYRLKWMVQLHVSSAKDHILKAMRDAGCTYVSYGIESMSKAVLDSMRKKTRPDRIEAALALTYEHHIGIQGNLLFGDTAETLETASESMHWWAFNRRYQVNLTPLMVFPGSPDYYQALRDGLILDREAYVANIPGRFNISRMNDKNLEMLSFQIWVHHNTLLNLAPLKEFRRSEHQVESREATYDIVWDCPRCGHENKYLGVVLPPDYSHSLRLSCRNCLSRWDIPNKASHMAANLVSASSRTSFRKLGRALIDKIRQRKYRDIVDKSREIILGSIPAALRAGRIYNYLIPSEHRLKSFGAALVRNPFDHKMHNDFAVALVKVGAFGAGRMHYEQSLALSPGNEEALAGIRTIDGPSLSETQRRTYFVSWSNAAPPVRCGSAETVLPMQQVRAPADRQPTVGEPVGA
ncbi:MAG: radical SAM protein [Sulfuritalea sp.]|nr:radical SAM protein [Sulfuritalea sp.]